VGRNAVKQKEPRVRDPGFLAFLRSKPCCYCGRPPKSEAAHIRYSDARYGKINPGMQQKPHDFWAVPLCAWCHRDGPDSQHNTGDERLFWAIREIDPCRLAIKLYAEYGGTGGTTKTRKRRPRQKSAVKRKIQGRTTWPKRKIPNRKFAGS
jgi:hypothetical protein